IYQGGRRRGGERQKVIGKPRMVVLVRPPPVFVWQADRSRTDEEGSGHHEERGRQELGGSVKTTRPSAAGLHAPPRRDTIALTSLPPSTLPSDTHGERGS